MSSAVLKFSDVKIKNSKECLELFKFMKENIPARKKIIKPLILVSIQSETGYVFEIGKKQDEPMYPGGMTA
jgi:hypothetical protein